MLYGIPHLFRFEQGCDALNEWTDFETEDFHLQICPPGSPRGGSSGYDGGILTWVSTKPFIAAMRSLHAATLGASE
jgi:hypothetical protein